jgi:hypothetical protein
MDIGLKELNNLKHLSKALSLIGYKSDSVVGELSGDKLFTNSKIKEEFIKIISEQDTFKPILNTIINLVELDIIVPANIRVGLLNKIKYLFFKDKKEYAATNHMLGFFDYESSKIFCLIENIEYGNSHLIASEDISLVILHELQHMTSAFFPSSFIKLHSKALITYYKRVFKLFFKVDVSDKDIYKVINWIHMATETISGRKTLSKKTITDYHNLMWTILKPGYTNTAQLQSDLFSYFNSVIIYLNNPTNYIRSVASHDPKCFFVYKALKESYKSLKIMGNIDSVCIQEIIFPSEVIAIESKYSTQDRHFKLITQIKK